MINIAHKRKEGLLKNLPAALAAKALDIVTILDDSYGEERDAEHDLGRYILVAETGEDVKATKEQTDLEHNLPENVDLITCEDGVATLIP